MASRVILSGDMLDGLAAERLGIVQWAFGPEDLERCTRDIAARIAALAPAAVRAAKSLIAAAGDPARDGFAEERAADRSLMS